LEIYNANGFITEDQIFDMLIESNISLHAFDVLTGELLDRGVIITSESEEADEDEDNDRTRTDYNIIFTEAVSVSPGLLPIIEYIKDIRPPQRNEWRVLMPQAKSGNQYALNRLFEMYLRVVVKLALGLYKRYGYELDDLLQEGALGLMKAICNYDFIIHGSFVSYFPFWVKQRIDRTIADKSRLIRIPVNMHQTMENMQTA
jgi:RNA polymerase primary sigma factor